MKTSIYIPELKSATIWHYVSKKNIKWMNDDDVNKYLKLRGSYNLIQSIIYFFKHRKKCILLAIYFDNEYIGNCGLFNIKDGLAELRISIGEKKLWGNGLGSETLKKMIYIANNYGLEELWLNVNPHNVRATKLYQNFGFKLTEDKDHFIDGKLQHKMSFKL